ncbi:MAG: HD domain-containing protein [Cyanobium sp.]
MLRAFTDLDPSPQALRAAGPSPGAITAPVITARASADPPNLAGDPPARAPIHTPADYGVPLPEWLQRCIDHVPPGAGESCPTDAEALLASAFDFAFQLHQGQYRASGEPYICHPIAVADLLRDIGASAPVIAAGFLHDVVEDTGVTPEEIEQHFGAEVRALVEGVTCCCTSR